MGSEAFCVTFRWDAASGGHEPLERTITRSKLAERDPEGTSLVAAKISFMGSKSIDMSPCGPGEDEYMSPELIKYVWEYMEHGVLDITPGIDPDDAERALEFFGFPDCKVVIPETDPKFMGKTLVFKHYREAMVGMPKIISSIKKTLLEQPTSAGVHLIVDDKKGAHTNQFGENVDVLIEQYSHGRLNEAPKQGTAVVRLGQNDYSFERMYRWLGGEAADKISTALRNKVIRELMAFGGIKAEWRNQTMAVADVGEYGHNKYSRELRWVLIISLNLNREESQEGIKRRKVM